MYRHYILTKFNTGLYSNLDKRIKIKPNVWMEHRLSLFEKFTLPSMMNQSCQNFSWLLSVDKQTPEKFIYRIRDFGYQSIKICFDSFEMNINTYEHSNFDIITTRIDNDDAFYVDFVKEIQCEYAKLVNESRPFAISFPLGYAMDLKSNQAIIFKSFKNNCPTLVCNNQNFISVRGCEHVRISSRYRTFYIKEFEPYWLLTIHSHNLCNQRIKQNRANWKKKKVKITNSILSKFGITNVRKGL